VRLLTVLTYIAIIFFRFAFVDNSDIIHPAVNVSIDGLAVLPEMQDCISCWEAGVKVMVGGALCPNLSYVYLLDFDGQDPCGFTDLI
jgi:hypothetical protein